jgi:sugar-specific transcriptional regulator TrmB
MQLQTVPHLALLRQLGLNEGESIIYSLLLENGVSDGKTLTAQSGMGRGNVYNALAMLKERNLVLEIQGIKAKYQVTSPDQLSGLLRVQQERAKAL